MPTPAERKAFAKYQAEHIKVYRIKLNDRTDGELIQHLDSLDNVQGYIKALIRADTEQSGCEFCTGENELYQHGSVGELRMGSFGGNRTLEFTYNACPPHAACSAKYLKNKAVFIINNCPNCGRKL